MYTEASDFTEKELKTGLTAQFERQIIQNDILEFARLSGDRNPLHIDANYAKTSNYQGCLVHGAFQVGLASSMLGMQLPGRRALLTSMNCRFPSPLYYPCRVLVQGVIVSWNRENRSGQLKVVIQEESTLTPTADIFLGFTLHERKRDQEDQECSSSAPIVDEKITEAEDKVVLVSGASGGIGKEIVCLLAKKYRVLGLVNKGSLNDKVSEIESVQELQVDFNQPGWEERIDRAIKGDCIYGVVHCAWPGAPKGGLLQSPWDVIKTQISFGVFVTIRLARLQFAHAHPEGGCFIGVGSIYGTNMPNIHLATYSLGKAGLENAVKLLAPEMALRKIRVNAISPSFVPVGMNKQASKKQIGIEISSTPLGRLCLPSEIAETIEFLLSQKASFISGQNIALNGGTL